MSIHEGLISTDVTIPVTGGAMPATLVRPEVGSGAGIVLVQEIFGRSGYLRSRARDLADHGYAVLIPQVYWRLGVDAIEEDSPAALEVAMETSRRVDWEQAAADIRAAVAWLRRDPRTESSVALVGFCFGGGLAYAAEQGSARDDSADALVCYYGSALPTLVDGPAVTTPSLHHFGDADAFIPAEDVAHVRDVVEANGAEFHLWDGANHAFDNPAPLGLHDPRASRDAWEVTCDWLAEHHPV